MRQLLEATLTQVVQSEIRQVVLPQFNGVYVTDCTRLVWGDSGLKMAVRCEIQRGRLQGNLMPLTQHDQRAALLEEPLPRGALHLGDLGFFNLQRFRTWNADGVYWLTRYKIGTCLFSLDGQPIDLKSLLVGDDPIRLTVPGRQGPFGADGALARCPVVRRGVVQAPSPPEGRRPPQATAAVATPARSHGLDAVSDQYPRSDV